MFYSLVFISFIFMVTGIYIDRKKIIDSLFLKLSKIRNNDEINAMEEKIKELEDKLQETTVKAGREKEKFEPIYEKTLDEPFFEVAELEIKEEDFQNTYEETKVKREELTIHSKVKQISKYEAEGRSIDEVSELMDMKKGEVLLLKKLYKKS